MIRGLSAVEAEENFDSLTELLVDAVESGGSVGFLPPLELAEAEAYWRTVVEAMRGGERELIVALEGGGVAGAVQLMCETRANGRRRASCLYTGGRGGGGSGSGAAGGVGAGGRGERNNAASDGYAERRGRGTAV